MFGATQGRMPAADQSSSFVKLIEVEYKIINRLSSLNNSELKDFLSLEFNSSTNEKFNLKVKKLAKKYKVSIGSGAINNEKLIEIYKASVLGKTFGEESAGGALIVRVKSLEKSLYNMGCNTSQGGQSPLEIILKALECKILN